MEASQPSRDPLAPLSMKDADRDAGGSRFIADMRRDYPTERELDRLLTRKMERRAGPGYSAVGLANLADCVSAMLQDKISGSFESSDLRWLTGGASKVQVGFTLQWDEPGRGPTTIRLVARMDPAESMNATSRQREFQILQAFAGVIPVPRVYWVDADATWFPQPTLIYAFAEGSAKPKAAAGKVSGVGTNFGPELRQRLAPQFIEYLAKIHTFNHERFALDAFDRPATGTTQSALWQLNRARRVWEEDRGEDLPLMEVAANWLERNLPVLDRVSALHGDYRSGNFLFHERDARITAILDWERGYLGDRHRDLAWTTARVCGHFAEDGKTFLVCGLVPTAQFLDEYQRLSGLSIDAQRLDYYRIFSNYQIVVSLVASSYRVVRLGKTHQDVLLARLEAAALGPLEELRRALEERL